MLTVNWKLFEFFVHILKLEVDSSNWVIFKDHFTFVVAAIGLEKHIDGTRTPPNPLAFILGWPFPLAVDQTAELELYDKKKSKWLMGEAVIKQAIATMISNSLFIEICKEITAHLMWEAVQLKWKKCHAW